LVVSPFLTLSLSTHHPLQTYACFTVFLFNLLKIYCDLLPDVPPDYLTLWVHRMVRTLRMEDYYDKIYLEMAHSRFMMVGLKSVPEHRIPVMLFSALSGFKVLSLPPSLSLDLFMNYFLGTSRSFYSCIAH
jgi:hypothetical protein